MRIICLVSDALKLQVDTAGIDMLLVGDSVAMVVHGHDTTLPVTLDEMILHCKAVYRGARRYIPFCHLVGLSSCSVVNAVVALLPFDF